jgi:hypothetical protein
VVQAIGYFAEVLLRQQRHRGEQISSRNSLLSWIPNQSKEEYIFSIAENCPVLNIFLDVTACQKYQAHFSHRRILFSAARTVTGSRGLF